MNIILVGGGKIGATVTGSLAAEGHNISVIDVNPRTVNDMVARYDVMGFCGNGAIYETQLEAGAAKADLLIATTASDELNILCCLVAKNIGVKYTIARVRNPEYSAQSSMFTNDFGVSLTVNPEYDTAMEISRILRFPSVNQVDSFFNGRVELVGIKIRPDSELTGLSLSDISRKYHSKVLICAVQRGGEVYIPDGSFVLQSDDLIHISGRRNDLSAFMKCLGEYKHRIRSVMLIGGGRIAYYLARQLDHCGMSVKLLESNMERCEELSSKLSDTDVVVVHGDGTSQEQLAAQGVSSQDAFVALTGIDEENIVMSMYAYVSKVGKVVTKVNRFPSEMLSTFGLDSVISPRSITATRIIAFVRAMHNSGKSSIRALYRPLNGQIEALEFEASEGGRCLSTPFKSLSLLPDLLVAAIMRKNKIIYPRGDDTIEPGDRVIVVTRQSNLTVLDDILR